MCNKGAAVVKTGPITVVHITQALCGVEVAIKNIIRHLDVSRFSSVVMLPPGTYDFMTKSDGQARTVFVPYERRINPAHDLRTLAITVRELKRLRPHIVHAHSAKGGYVGRIAGWLLGIPTIYTPHAFSFLSSSSPATRRRYIVLEKMARACTSLLVACSESERRLACEKIGFRPEKTATWVNSIAPALLHPYPRTYDFDYICMAGRPSYQKNIDMLVRVMALLRGQGLAIKCILAGVGFFAPLEQRLRDMIHAEGLDDAFVLLPWVSHEQALGIIAHSRCYVSTARYEGMPLTVIEAMGLGKAVVATDVVGNTDCISHGLNGFLVPLDDSQTMVNRIVELLGNEALRAGIGEAARQHMIGCLDITKNIGGLEALYCKTAAGEGPHGTKI